MRSLSLKAYQALMRSSGAEAVPTVRQTRPDGALLWVVVADESELRAALYLFDRLMHLRQGCALLISGDPALAKLVKKPVLFDPLPHDSTEAVAAFLSHWRADICLWMSQALHPLLLADAKSRGTAMILHGCCAAQLEQNMWRWVPKLARDTLRCFDSISVENADVGKQLGKVLNVGANHPESTPLQIATPPPRANAAQFQELTEMIAGRPLWLAARVQEDELSDVLEAHRMSVRLTHRLLLVLVCASFPTAMTARKRLVKDSWRCCYWDDGDIIDEATQIVLVEEPDELGLWMRAAPVSFLGSSLFPGSGGSDPYEAAALGSAILYGPHVRAHLSSYSRLANVGAARIVSDAANLARALSQLLAVDQAASMAHAAWEIVSTGAEATDALAEQIQDCLDTREMES